MNKRRHVLGLGFFLSPNPDIMLKQLHALVVDDEPHCREMLCRQIERTCPSIRVLQTASSAKEAHRLIDELVPDVVFMDIHMPHLSGLELMDRVSRRDFYLVFTTAFDQYVVEALRRDAFDYLLKPIDREDLLGCSRRVLMHFYHHRTPGKGAISPATRRLEVSTTGKKHFVRHSDIIHVEAEGSYTTLHLLTGKKLTLSKNLKKVEEMLDNDMFFRAHNSHLVQLDQVRSCNYRENTLTLIDGRTVPMAVRKREALKHRMSLLMTG